MGVRLKDIIDLDYLVGIDDALDSGDDIRSRTIKDRKIYSQCGNGVQTDRSLLFAWLDFRRQEFLEGAGDRGSGALPGSLFSSLYSWTLYAMVFSGLISGVSLVYSFLAYHGKSPINVAVFLFVFVLLQVVLVLLALVLLLITATRAKNARSGSHGSVIQTLVSWLFSSVVPAVAKRVDLSSVRSNLDTLEYVSSLIRIRSREYGAPLFWSIFMLTSVFAVCFSMGALGGLLFRVVVSDLAFGWQSTLMATGCDVHGIVSAMALPWSWFVPGTLAHPTLEQIEGTRIVLKDGILVLATEDLVSWWPFISLGILFYAVIARGSLFVMAVLAQRRAVKDFGLDEPKYRQLIARMRSPLLDIDADETSAIGAAEGDAIRDLGREPAQGPGSDVSGQKALLLVPRSVYGDEAIEMVRQGVRQRLLADVRKTLEVSLDPDGDAEGIRNAIDEETGLAILLYEAWQPPIRGLLHYITQVKATVPRGAHLWVLLTAHAGEESLIVDDDDLNLGVWRRAVSGLRDPEIVVKRLL